MATFTIGSIDGNSYIGVPVFSRFGQMQNYNYIVMSPQKKLNQKNFEQREIIDQENKKFMLQPVEAPPSGMEQLSRSVDLNRSSAMN